MTQLQPTLPTFGEIVPGAGGRLGAIMRGALGADGKRAPDYAVIVVDAKDGGDLGKMKWGEYVDVPGANSLTDGIANTKAMADAGSECARKAVKLGLYIPSRGEMWTLRANVPELFAQEWHWTSTQGDRNYAIVQDFANGNSYWDGKDDTFRVRAVRRIQLQHFTA